MSNRRLFAQILAAAVLLVLPLAGSCRTRPRPNIILIVIDTLRQDHLPAYGYPRMTAPAITRLATAGAVFDARAVTSWTKPSVASILTGSHPVRHQAIGRTDALQDRAELLSEVLKKNGYTTVGVSSNGWISKGFGFDQGFDSFIGLAGAAPGDAAARKAVDAPAVTDAALAQLQRLREPYFLFVHYLDPHAPYEPGHDWGGRPLPADTAAKAALTTAELNTINGRSSPQLRQAVIDLYDGEIRQTDTGIDRLLQALAKANQLTNTITIITADHGEEFLEHGLVGHGQSLYDEVLKVPLIIHGPGIAAGARKGVASIMDIFPTILDLAAIRHTPKNVDGMSIREHLASPGASIPDRDFLYHLDLGDRASDNPATPLIQRSGLAFTSAGQKLVLGRNPYRKEVFDLRSDAGERSNLLGRAGHQDGTFRLARGLADRYNQLSRRRLQRVTAAPDPEGRARLVALGYITPSRGEEVRGIPGGIQPADISSGGFLGWERAESLHGCISTSDRAAEGQLLKGWHPIELGGRWTEATATVAFGGGGGSSLIIEGISHRPDSFALSVDADGGVVAEEMIRPGPFRVTAQSKKPIGSPSLMTLRSDPPFIPASRGGSDTRELGAFITSICMNETRKSPGPQPPVAKATPLPDSAFKVVWEHAEVPARVNAGAGVPVSIRVRNASDQTWPDPTTADPVKRDGSYAVRLSYRWIRGNARPAGFEGFEPRVNFSRSIPPGASETLSFSVQAPSQPGAYQLQFDLVQDLVAWFGSKGASNLVVPVRVQH